MRDLNYQLKQLCHQCREGSYATQSKREYMLTLMANQLHELGYRKMTPRSLKPKHIAALVKLWFKQELSIGTIKNRMAVIRWWAHKVNKNNVVARSNEHYGIPDRRFITNESKAKTVTLVWIQDLQSTPERICPPRRGTPHVGGEARG